MKRSFSLTEVLIALSLISILITALFVGYNHMTSSKLSFRKKEWTRLEQRYCHQRLDKILSSCEGPFFTSSERQAHLAAGSLVFTFDRGVAQEPELSGRVLGRLYFDPQAHCLMLGVWPLVPSDLSETYILLDSIQSCSMEFYQPPSFETPVQHPTVGWHRSWDATHLPALCKIEIEREQKKHTFAFDLGSPIRYCRSGI